MFNEPSSAVCECPVNKDSLQSDNVSSNVYKMDETKNIEKQDIFGGSYFNRLPNSSTPLSSNGVDKSKDNFMNGFIFDFNRSSKLIDDEVDKVSLSSESEEDEKVSQNLERNIKEEGKLSFSTYEKESSKINELYNNDENDESINKYFGTKNELLDVKVIPTVFPIEDSYKFLNAGTVMNKSVEGKFVMMADTINGILDLDNIVFNQNKLPIGYIDDVLGKIDSPFYIVKYFPNYNGNTDLQGEKLCFVKEKVKFVNKFELIKLKGSDASNVYDEEVDDDEKEFSDDEEEKARKEKLKKRNKNNDNNKKYPNNYNGLRQNPQNTYFDQSKTQFPMNYNNCQEYKINSNNIYSNQNIYANNNYNNQFIQQQQYLQNMTMFNPNSMFSPYSNPKLNNANINVNPSQINQMNNQFFQHINPFIHNNFNK